MENNAAHVRTHTIMHAHVHSLCGFSLLSKTGVPQGQLCGKEEGAHGLPARACHHVGVDEVAAAGGQ
eukprot:1159466-Pelagomonas_calceolata.AAC.1